MTNSEENQERDITTKTGNQLKISIEYIDISKLKFADYNPRRLTDDQYAQLKRSIEENGFVDPVIVNKHPERKNTIIGGHMRVRVAKDLGYDEVPCVFLNMPFEQERIFNVRLNKNTGEWDFDMLANHYDYEELLDIGFGEGELVGFGDMNIEYSDKDISNEDQSMHEKMTFILTNEQVNHVKEAIENIKKTDKFKYIETYGNTDSDGNALYALAMGEI